MAVPLDRITIRKPDDWHVHLRDGAMLKAVLPYTMERFGRAIAMPNFAGKPITTTADVIAYKREIETVRGSRNFTPLMTYYLTDQTDPNDVSLGFREGHAAAVKFYPVNATTNSENGVTDIEKVYPIFEELQKIGMPLLMHGETLIKEGKPVEPRDREKVFLDSRLPKLLKNFPELKIVLEHATTKDAVDFVRGEDAKRLASTITVHHLMMSSGDVAHDDHPEYLYCMPVIKTPNDRAAIRAAATSGDLHFFLGSDSAPHSTSAKESARPPVGIFTAPAVLELYAQVFDEENKLENLEKFASLNGAAFYGFPVNEETITLEKNPWTLDSLIETEDGEKLRPFGYDEDPAKRLKINWKLAE